MSDLDGIFDAAEAVLDEADEFVTAAGRQDRDRSVIAGIVVGAFVGLIALITLGTLFFNWLEWEKPATFLLQMLSSVLLPVVTLVIGYYFGKEKAEG